VEHTEESHWLKQASKWCEMIKGGVLKKQQTLRFTKKETGAFPAWQMFGALSWLWMRSWFEIDSE
jgi:hypothetical protein